MVIRYRPIVLTIVPVMLLAQCSEDRKSSYEGDSGYIEGGAGVDSAMPSDKAGSAIDARSVQTPQDSSFASGSGGESGDAGFVNDGQPADSAEKVDSETSSAYNCDNPRPSWLLCEDFEAGSGDFDAWLSASEFISGVGDDDRGRVTLSSSYKHSGDYALYMPAAESSGFQGGSVDWRDCIGAQETNCRMNSHEQLYFRVWIRFAEDHRYVHHFLNIGGSQPDDYWYHGTAGCLPNGELAMGTTVDFREESHESFFYTYFPEMSCDTRCERYADVGSVCQECADKGLPTCTQQPQCCWGNLFEPEPPVAFPTGVWFCFEMMMQANSPGEHDGLMAYWVDDVLALEVDSMMWRTSETLALNRIRIQHYITESDAQGYSNRVFFDDAVVSTERIGCY